MSYIIMVSNTGLVEVPPINITSIVLIKEAKDLELK